jgi:peptidyl-prolyl cis-trans isomerase D
MSVLEKIRTKMGIFVSVVIGLALLAFVLGDFLGSGNSILNNDRYQVAEISGQKVQFQEFDNIVNQITDVYKFNSGQSNITEDALNNIREQSWQQLVDKYVMGNEYEALGLSVCSKEFLDMVQGANPHPYIRQLFTDPQTHEFNRAAVVQFVQSLGKETDPARKNYWLFIENSIIRERYMTKYMNLISKGLYITSQQVNKEISDNSRKVSFSFMGVSYASIPDSLIPLKMSELKDYLKEHAKEYEQDASRDIEYVSFDIVPSSDDYAAAKKWIDDNKEDFISTNDIKQFVNMNSDIPFSDKYLKLDELSDSLKVLYNAKVGDYVGPFFENDAYIIARLVDVKNIPDSVRARHILLRPEANTQEAYNAAKAKADSILNLIKKGADFAELAKKFSVDGSASNGGDLGWFHHEQMVKEFSDACFNAKKGEPMIVETKYGIHVVEVTDKGKEVKKVQIAQLVRNVNASNITQQAIYQKASSFAGNYNTGERFVEGVKKLGITPVKANFLTDNMREVPGLPGSRELIRWVFQAKPNTISGVMELGDKFVIARLTQVREKGIATVDQVKDQLAVLVRREKKAKQLMERLEKEMATTPNLLSLAQKESSKVDSVVDITFSSYALPTVGFEPSLIAAAVVSPLNKLSGPVKGNNGVYIFQNFNENIQEVDRLMILSKLTNSYYNRANYEPVNVLKKAADIKDMRSKFY